MENEAISGFVYGVTVLLVLLYLFLAVVNQKSLPSEHHHSCVICFLRQKDQQPMFNNGLQLRRRFPQLLLFKCARVCVCVLVTNYCVFMCAWSCSSRRRRNACCRDPLLNKVTIIPRSPATPPVLLRDCSFSPTPAHAPRCPPPCPHCPRKRRIPPRSWTVPPAPPVRWVAKSTWGCENNPFGPGEEILLMLLLKSVLFFAFKMLLLV